MNDTPLERLARGEAAEPEYEEVLYWLWLADILRPGNPASGAVLDAYGNAREVYLRRELLDDFAAVAGKAAARRLAENACTPADYLPLRQECLRKGVHILAYEDAGYPWALKALPDPPLVLYCTGDPVWLNHPTLVGVVGSRRPTAYGVEVLAQMGPRLAEGGAVIVSGLADGLDSEGHKAALRAGAATVAVMGVPIDQTYPAANGPLRRRIEQNGTVVSEYPPGFLGRNGVTFLQRNRIIAGLSAALLVVEAREQSGTMSTVRHAERYGVPIFAVPGSVFAELCKGTNGMLRDGRAKAVTCAADLLRAIGVEAAAEAEPQKKKQRLNAEERAVLTSVGAQPQSLSELAAKSGVAMGPLLSILSKLEMEGFVTAQPGRRYILH